MTTLELIESLAQFILIISDKWATLTTGGIVIALVAGYERWKGRNTSWSAYLSIVLLAFVIACFQAWNDERQTIASKDQQLATAAGTIRNLSGDSQAARIKQLEDRLQSFDLPSSLSEAQSVALSDLVKEQAESFEKGRALAVFSNCGQRAQTLASQIVQSLRNGGLVVFYNSPCIGERQFERPGIVLSFDDPKTLGAPARALISIFNRLGVSFVVNNRAEPLPGLGFQSVSIFVSGNGS